MLQQEEQHLVSDEFCIDVYINGVSEKLISECSAEVGIFLRSIQAHRRGNLKRALNMGLRFHQYQKALPENYLVVLLDCARKIDRLADLFDVFMDFAYAQIELGNLDKALHYMRLPFAFPRAGKHIYNIDKMSKTSEKLGELSKSLKNQYSFKRPH